MAETLVPKGSRVKPLGHQSNWRSLSAPQAGSTSGCKRTLTLPADQVGSFFQRTMELSGGAFSIDVHNVLAENDLVVALVTVNAQRNGHSASFPEVHVWRMKNGKATDFREYQGDEQREDQFWS